MAELNLEASCYQNPSGGQDFFSPGLRAESEMRAVADFREEGQVWMDGHRSSSSLCCFAALAFRVDDRTVCKIYKISTLI